MRNIKRILILPGAVLWLAFMPSCNTMSLSVEKQIVQGIHAAACGESNFDPCYRDPKWPICAPGESWATDMCAEPTCPGGHVTHLDLSCSSKIPPEIGQLGQLPVLEALRVSNIRLFSLPPEIGQLSNLRVLNLYGSQLTNLPPEFGQLSNLEELDLSGNQLTSLPAGIGQLSELRILNLHGNRLTSLPPEIGLLANLEELDLSGNQLTSLPPEIGLLANLEELDISGNQLTNLPAEIGQLTHLNRLDIDNNPLNGPMPTFLINLPLEQLGYGVTGLCIPDDEAFLGWRFGGFWMCSEMTQLPEAEYAALLSLYEQVGLDGSWHPDIPPCRWVGVSCWNGHVRNIQLFNWSSHELTQLPVEVTQLSQLESLELGGNKLKALPPEIGQLEHLTRLTLNDNLFATIPPEIGYLRQLESLDLSGNPLSGPIPDFLVELPLVFFNFERTVLCIPNDETMKTWIDGLVEHSNDVPCLP